MEFRRGVGVTTNIAKTTSWRTATRRAYYVGDMEYQVTINFAKPIPVFPLPNAVLMPHAVLPLHIFESRYRQMTTDALDSHGLIAMALFDQEPDHQEYLHGQPSLRPIVCAGYVERYEKLSDGRYLLLLRGLCRAKINEEVPHEPYRTAMLEPIDWPPTEDTYLTEERDAIADSLRDPQLDHIESIEELRTVIEQPVPTVGLIDLVIAATAEGTKQRYDMLCETDAHARARWVIHHLASLRRVSSSSRRRGREE